jgi:hypothetical protein
VLVNQIGVEVLPEAAATFESLESRTHQRLDHMRFIHDRQVKREIVPLSMKAAKAAKFAELDMCTQMLSDLFFDNCLGKLRALEAEEEDDAGGVSSEVKEEDDAGGVSSDLLAAPTPSERARFRRALYRFETFCNIRRQSLGYQMWPDEDILDKFFRCFSSWELE